MDMLGISISGLQTEMGVGQEPYILVTSWGWV